MVKDISTGSWRLGRPEDGSTGVRRLVPSWTSHITYIVEPRAAYVRSTTHALPLSGVLTIEQGPPTRVVPGTVDTQGH